MKPEKSPDVSSPQVHVIPLMLVGSYRIRLRKQSFQIIFKYLFCRTVPETLEKAEFRGRDVILEITFACSRLFTSAGQNWPRYNAVKLPFEVF